MSKKFTRMFALVLSVVMVFALGATAFAADVPDATIDTDATGSITIYKYDLTSASLDSTTKVDVSNLSADALANLNTALTAAGKSAVPADKKVPLNDLLAVYTSDGVDNAALREALTNPDTTEHPGSENAGGEAGHILGNGQTEYGYAIKGVEFSYLKVAEIIQYTSTEANGVHKDIVLYEMDDTADTALLAAIGLTNDDAYPTVNSALFTAKAGKHYFESDTLVNAIKTALQANPTEVKNKLEAYAASQNGFAKFDETNDKGYTTKGDLPLGLYLILETKVPEQVTATVNPFFVSVPMTTINGTVATNGGQQWLYDVTVFPKNETGIPSLEKTVRESLQDTATWEDNNNNSPIDDGYAHNATGSDGDRMEYQIISKLPSITSDATSLTMYTFVDTLSKGLEYDGNRAEKAMLKDHFDPNNVKIEFFKDAECTEANKITTWALTGGTAGGNDGTSDNFAVAYGTVSTEAGSENPVTTGRDAGATTMTITMKAAGLEEINHSKAVYTDAMIAAGEVQRGYSNCYMRITYSCTINQSEDVVYGDQSNPNTVDLTWKRSNTNYWDTLSDDCHVYTYALHLTKEFSDDQGNFSNVQFKIFNKTDNYWVTAVKAADGLYYVEGTNGSYENGALNDAAATDHVAGHVAGASDDDMTTSEVSATDEDGSKGTTFVPNAQGDLWIYGLEDDEYIITEVQTDNGYTLLKDNINVVISTTLMDGSDAAHSPARECDIYSYELLNGHNGASGKYGVWQNKFTGEFYTETAFAQKAMQHFMLTASATVDGDAVVMLNDNDDVDTSANNSQDTDSTNAIVPLTVINTRGFDLPKTGAEGTVLYGVIGVVGLSAIALAMFFVFGKKRKEEEDAA